MNKKSEQTIAIAISVFIFSSIVAFIFFPVSEAKTIILQTPSGTDSCVTDFVLAQNLTDLCDVTIIDPSTSQIIEYNGTQWVNVNATTFTDTTVCNNLGTGAIICAGGNVNLRTLIGSPDISVVQNANDITIDYNGTIVSDNTVCANVGGGFEVFRDGECNFRTLLEGTSIDITQGADTLTLTNTAPESTACNNVGTGNQLCSGGNINIDTLIAGTGITISDTTDDWTFASQCANTGTGEPVCESSNNINSLIAGTGITIADTTGDLTITNTVTDTNACTNTGTGEAVCESANNINSLIAGTGITITDTTGDLTVTNVGAIKLCEAVSVGGETTLTCTLSSSTFNSIKVISSFTSTQADTWVLRFNGDSGSNYNIRSSTNGGADATSGAVATYATVTITANQWYHYNFACNEPLASVEKHCYGFRQTSATGAGNADARVEFASKWANTASLITDTELVRTAGTGTMTAGSFITVWGIA